MKEETAIIPIAPGIQDSAVNLLIETKRSYSQMDLARMGGDELRRLQRLYYKQAVEANLLTVINLTIRQLGSIHVGTRLTNWEHRAGSLAITGSYDNNAGTTEVSVNGHLVCSNTTPGCEVFVPGNWMREIVAIFRLIDAEKAWKQGIVDGVDRERRILDLSAEV